jgi:hypothetical protein
MIVIKVMCYRFGRLFVLKYTEIECSLMFGVCYLQGVVDPEIITHMIVNLPAQLIITCRRNDSNEKRGLKEIFQQLILIQL